MRTRLLIVLALVACKAKAKDQPPTPQPVVAIDAPPPAPPTFDVCKAAIASLEKATCTTDAAKKSIGDAKQALSGIVDMVAKVGSDTRQFQVKCGQLVLALERDATNAGCTLVIESKAEVVKVLEEWYAQRTEVKPTGDAAGDAFVAKVVAIRDATCACKDAACLDLVDKQLTTIGEPPAAAAAKELAGKLLEDTARCAARIRTLP